MIAQARQIHSYPVNTLLSRAVNLLRLIAIAPKAVTAKILLFTENTRNRADLIILCFLSELNM